MNFIQVLLCSPLLMARQEEPKAPQAISREAIYREGETLRLKVRAAQASQTVVTAVRFDRKITEILSAWNQETLSLEHSGD